MRGSCDFTVACILAVFTLALIGFAVGLGVGFKNGYTAALDDARLGKPARYKLVQTAEKWVEVER